MTFPRYLIFIIIVQCNLLQLVTSQPADLGSFNSHNDLPNGLSSFSLPAEERLGGGDPYVLSIINYTYVNEDGHKVHYSQEKGKYGEGKIANVIGKLVHVTDHNDVRNHTACSPYIRGTNGAELPSPGKWIALVKRGKCNFEDKVAHVYHYGAIGVLVYNDRDSVTLDKMKIQMERNITAVFTHKWLGEEMGKLVDEGMDLTVSLSEGRHSKLIPNINRPNNTLKQNSSKVQEQNSSKLMWRNSRKITKNRNSIEISGKNTAEVSEKMSTKISEKKTTESSQKQSIENTKQNQKRHVIRVNCPEDDDGSNVTTTTTTSTTTTETPVYYVAKIQYGSVFYRYPPLPKIYDCQREERIRQFERTSVLFVSISFIVLMIISLVWLIFYYVQRFRYLQTKDRKSRQLCSVAKRIISKIPTKSIKSDDKEIENDCCAICIEPYKVTDLIRMLPCRHDFHKCCVDPWLLEHRTCPMCKMDILKHYGFVFTGSQESILQLDLDLDIGDGNGGFGEEAIRARSASPTFVIQLDHEQIRRSSVESVTSIQREVPTESYPNNEEEDTAKTKCAGCSNAFKKSGRIDDSDPHEHIRESISLPCTLRKCKSSESCRGSNNCYVWALDCDHLNRKMEKIEKGCPKSRTTTTCNDNRDSDNEFLLADKNIYENVDSTPEHDLNPNATNSNHTMTESELRRRSSVVNERMIGANE